MPNVTRNWMLTCKTTCLSWPITMYRLANRNLMAWMLLKQVPVKLLSCLTIRTLEQLTKKPVTVCIHRHYTPVSKHWSILLALASSKCVRQSNVKKSLLSFPPESAWRQKSYNSMKIDKCSKFATKRTHLQAKFSNNQMDLKMTWRLRLRKMNVARLSGSRMRECFKKKLLRGNSKKKNWNARKIKSWRVCSSTWLGWKNKRESIGHRRLNKTWTRINHSRPEWETWKT